LPPSVLAVLEAGDLPALRTVVAAGEACSFELVHRWAVDGREFFNAYGPTETTVCASMHRCTGNEDAPPPIGRPLANIRLYVLDGQQRLVPTGVPGELCVGGVGLARGYLRRRALTAEKFVPDPFSGEAGARLYRTGDLVRYRADGNLEFLGRIDHQVKLRGFRVELGEIEAILESHPTVREAVVLARTVATGDERLVAYVVPADDENPPSRTQLRDLLRAQLPGYMVPAVFVVLNEFPLTPAGKVDRRALPAPDAEPLESSVTYVGPRTDLERELVRLFAELLGTKRVGINDDFFELGGHSLLATQLVSQVRERFQVELALRSFFEAPTVAGLSQQIESAHGAERADLDKIQDSLTTLEELSADEVRMLLERRRSSIGSE
jgi:acyl carrier protein